MKLNSLAKKTASYFLGVDNFYPYAREFCVDFVKDSPEREQNICNINLESAKSIFFNNMFNCAEIVAAILNPRISTMIIPAIEAIRFNYNYERKQRKQEFNFWKQQVLYQFPVQSLDEIMEEYDEKQEKEKYWKFLDGEDNYP
ncbi:MAG: hypothetical protein WC438_05095 [Candidatus Pacearchaeota archaeon]